MQRQVKQSTTPSARSTTAHESALHRVRILCIDDAPDIVYLLSRLIRRQPDLEDLGSVDTLADIVHEVRQREADILIMDLTIPGESPLDAIRELARRVPSCRVIAYSGHDDAETRSAVLAAGACELVGKDTEPGELIRTIHRIAYQRLIAG